MLSAVLPRNQARDRCWTPPTGVGALSCRPSRYGRTRDFQCELPLLFWRGHELRLGSSNTHCLACSSDYHTSSLKTRNTLLSSDLSSCGACAVLRFSTRPENSRVLSFCLRAFPLPLLLLRSVCGAEVSGEEAEKSAGCRGLQGIFCSIIWCT